MTEKKKSKSEKPKDEVETTDKKTDEVKLLKVKENSNFGHFIVIVTLNILACMALKYHFAGLFKELNGNIDILEQNTNLIYRYLYKFSEKWSFWF